MEEDLLSVGISDSDEDDWDVQYQQLDSERLVGEEFPPGAGQLHVPVELDTLGTVALGCERRTSVVSSVGGVESGVLHGSEYDLSSRHRESKSGCSDDGPENPIPAVPPSNLDEAILSERIDVVNQFLLGMGDKEAREVLISCCKRSWVEETGLVTVARRGNVDMLLGVLTEVWRRCSVQEILDTVPADYSLTSIARPLAIMMMDMENSRANLTAVAPANRAISPLRRMGAMVTAVFLALHRRVGKVVPVVLPRISDYDGIPPAQVNPMIVAVVDQMRFTLGDALRDVSGEGSSELRASHKHTVDNLDVVLGIIVKRLPAIKVKDVFSRALRKATRAMNRLSDHDQAGAKQILEVVTVVFKHGGEPAWRDLMRLGWANARGVCSMEMLEDCFFGALESARNPFIPGIPLSIALSDAIRGSPEGYRRTFGTLQEGVDELLLEVLERLPQTVRGFPDGMAGCRCLFEPETTGDLPAGFEGPLRLLVQREKQMRTFCVSPLVMDYLSRKFTRGLPNSRDTEGAIEDKHGLNYLRSEGLVVESNASCDVFNGRELQGAGTKSLTYLGGAQFVIAGVVARPAHYYRVPSLRLIWDLIVYIIMLVLYDIFVLMYPDGPVTWWDYPLTRGEVGLAVYIVAALATELREIGSGLHIYTRDRWNTLDLLALVLLSAGLISRIIDNDSSWGRGFYALSFPVVMSRLLFFAQLFRFQGPMVQVIFAMTTELSRFATVMIVVVFGFVNALHALVPDKEMSYGETWRSVFSAMLGDVGIFEYFTAEENFSQVGVALVVVYFVITNIMLLNLLIGLLTTEYERVQEEIDVEYKMSKTRLIQHYDTVVEKDWLPAPFNLVQLVISSPFLLVDLCCQTKMYGAARAAVGSVFFWILSGILAVPLGSLLWIISSPRAVWVNLKSSQTAADVVTSGEATAGDSLIYSSGTSLWSETCGAIYWVLWCSIGAPLSLLAYWLIGAGSSVTGAALWLRNDLWGYLSLPDAMSDVSSVDAPIADRATVGRILSMSSGMTVTKLRRYLENPMIDPEVREDEKSKDVTVEHLKLLRDRLEGQIAHPLREDVGQRVCNMEESLKALSDELSLRNDRLDKVEQKLDDILARVAAAADTAGDG